MNIIVYHIFCVDDYENVVINQMNRVIKSGLYDWCDRFEITCIDLNNQFIGIDKIFEGLNKINIFKTNENKYEYWAIKKIWDLSQIFDGKIFYFHTKGVSNRYTNLNEKKNSEWKIKGVNTWKEKLEYFLIDNFEECLIKLDSYETCGVTSNNKWYSGNFWWANTYFLKTNNPPCIGDRWYYENWLYSEKNYNGYEFFHFDYNGYFSYYPDYVFNKNNKLHDFNCELIDAYYGAIDIQQDEGYGINLTEELIDVTLIVNELIEENNISVVDNVLFTDPAYMKKKYLIINFKINNDICRVVYNEGWRYDISFLKKNNDIITNISKKQPKILFLGYTSKEYDGHSIKIDRADLTRKLSCLETWCPEVEDKGHDVLFFQGDSDILNYDEKNRLLSIPLLGGYDYNPCILDEPKSLMLDRLIYTIEWAIKNKDFDYIFRTDDGSYINYFILDKIYDEIKDYDVIFNHYGGGGMFFSKECCLKIIELNNLKQQSLNHHIEDIAISIMLNSLDLKIKYSNLFNHQYILSEKSFTIHYTNGKRMYFVDSILKRYFLEDNVGKRKVILNYPIHDVLDNNNTNPNTFNYDNGITPIWYSYTTNHLNWEHYGMLMRSNFTPVVYNPFGVNSINKLIFYKTIFNIDTLNEKETLLNYLLSINEDGVIIFFNDNYNDLLKNMVEFLSKKDYIIDIIIDNIETIVSSKEIKSEEGYIIKIKK
jgi:hypothetical protein